MTDDFIIKLAIGQMPTDKEIANELYEICEREHSSCNSDCPVYALNGNEVPDTTKDFKVNRGCDCFKNGTSMLNFIRNHKNQ